MAAAGLCIALALTAGAACGARLTLPVALAGSTAGALAVAAAVLSRRTPRGARAAGGLAAFVCGAALAADARHDALHTTLRAVLDAAHPGFALETLGPPPPHDPVQATVLLTEDAAPGETVTSLRGDVRSVALRGVPRPVRGGVVISVAGAPVTRGGNGWVAGRTLEIPLTFRRPARYLNDGVPDFEADLALDGTTLFASAKSGLLVDVAQRGSWTQERAALARAHARRSVARWVGARDALAAAIVAAVLIGDRTGLPDEVRLRLQAAGTYHVIAISGGNIAILAALCLALGRLLGLAGRLSAALTLLLLLAYAAVVSAGASVWRATVMAALYMAARMLDLRTPPRHALAVAAAIVLCVRPLDTRNVGFLLTFTATAALVEIAARMRLPDRAQRPWRRAAGWVLATCGASLAVEVALLPINASAFSRVTAAGLLLNLLAIPLMGVAQVSGLLLVALDGFSVIAAPAGWVAAHAGRLLVESARLVDFLPWTTARVPPPPAWLVAAHYALLTAALGSARMRVSAAVPLFATSLLLATGGPPPPPPSTSALRLTINDVGQGEAILIEPPGAAALLVDTGGPPFGGGGFDMGGRVLAPALWARGIRRLGALLLTHGDPDHIGGAAAVIADFTPARVWEGIAVPRHRTLQAVLASARAHGAIVGQRYRGQTITAGAARLRVLHPPPADWERPRVRNDDSLAVELLYGDVAILLPGDIGADVEQQLLPALTQAPVRILKVAHHGSRTSTSGALVEQWRPQIAVVSAGRGNTFGHPAPEVLARLASIGAAVYRTDRHGQITIESDGRGVRLTTYVAALERTLLTDGRIR